MNEKTITRFANRFKPSEFINIEADRLMTGPIQPGWLSAQWLIEQVPGTSYVRFKNLWKPDKYLHIEGGIPEAGPIEPGWLSAQWEFEPIPTMPFARIRNRFSLARYANIETGEINIGQVFPGWLSAHWLLEKVQGTSFVRLRNRWKPDQGLHIESGVLSAGPVELGMLSAQWSVEKVAGTSYVRFKNRWKPDQYFHIESGRAEAGPIQPGWLSAQWFLEQVEGTNFVWLRNRWEIERYLHIERGVLEVGVVEPGWLSAQWTTAVRNKIVPLELLQRKFDEFFNERSRPLFKFRLHGEDFGNSTLSVFFDDPVTGYRLHGTPKDLGHLEIDLTLAPNPDYHFDDLNSDRITLNIIPEEPAGIEVKIHFETEGEELKINNFPNVNIDGLNVTITFRFGKYLRLSLFGISEESLVDLATNERSVVADASVNVTGIPDGVVAREIESKMNTKVFEALQENRADLNRLVTRFLLGGDYQVTSVSSNGQALTIDYLVPHGGQVEPFPENPQPPLDPGLLAKIDHIVVLMMENRSFDHMLGYLSKHGGRADVDGLRGGEKNRYTDRDYPSFPSPTHCFR